MDLRWVSNPATFYPMAPNQGFEPRPFESESNVLPLHQFGRLAGAGGFEPPNTGSKPAALPITLRPYTVKKLSQRTLTFGSGSWICAAVTHQQAVLTPCLFVNNSIIVTTFSSSIFLRDFLFGRYSRNRTLSSPASWGNAAIH